MASYINNSYIYGIFSGIAISTMAQYGKGDVPLSLSMPMSMIIHRSFSNASTFIEEHKKTLDKNISKIAVPSTCVALTALHIANRDTSSIYDLALKTTLLGLFNKPIIQPLIRFIAPAKTLSSLGSVINKIPVVREAPTFQKFCTSYFASLVTTQFFERSFQTLTRNSLPICQAFGILAFGGFLAADLFNFLMPIPSEIIPVSTIATEIPHSKKDSISSPPSILPSNIPLKVSTVSPADVWMF